MRLCYHWSPCRTHKRKGRYYFQDLHKYNHSLLMQLLDPHLVMMLDLMTVLWKECTLVRWMGNLKLTAILLVALMVAQCKDNGSRCKYKRSMRYRSDQMTLSWGYKLYSVQILTYFEAICNLLRQVQLFHCSSFLSSIRIGNLLLLSLHK